VFFVVRYVDALNTAIQFLPLGLIIFVITPIAVLLLPRIGSKWTLALGGTLTVCGAVLMTYIYQDTPYWNIPFASMILNSSGFGFIGYAAMLTGMSGAPPKWRGAVSALLNVAFQIGAGIFLAISSAIAQSTANMNVETSPPSELTVGYHNALYVQWDATLFPNRDL